MYGSLYSDESSLAVSQMIPVSHGHLRIKLCLSKLKITSIDGSPIEKVEHFKYLGTIFSDNGMKTLTA